MKAEIKCLYAEVWLIDKFVEHPRNPNSHPIAQLELLGKILLKQGWRSPIVVSALSGYVIKGHGRLAAAKHAGLTECPVDIQNYASASEEIADMIADNRIAELSERDDESVLDLISSLDLEGAGTESAGYSSDDFKALVASVEEEGRATGAPRNRIGGQAIQYNIIFDDDTQQQQFFALLKSLKGKYPAIESAAGRLSAFCSDVVANPPVHGPQ